MAIIDLTEPVESITKGLVPFNKEGDHSIIYPYEDKLLKVLKYPARKNTNQSERANDYKTLQFLEQLDDSAFITPIDLWRYNGDFYAYTMRYARGKRFDKIPEETEYKPLLLALDRLKDKIEEKLSAGSMQICDFYYDNIYYNGKSLEVGDLDAYTFNGEDTVDRLKELNDREIANKFLDALGVYFGIKSFCYFVENINKLKYRLKREFLSYEQGLGFINQFIEELEKKSARKITTLGETKATLKLIHKDKYFG